MTAQVRHYSRLLIVVVLLSAAAPAGADEWPVARGPSREPNPYRYDAATWTKVPRDYLEDASACILYSGTSHLVAPDGTIETTTHEITRLNGRKGIDKLGEYHSITYAPAYQKLTLNVAHVLKPGGQVVEIEPRHVQLRDQGTDYQVYDPDKQLVISFPNLQVGDVIEVKWTVRGKNPEHFGHFFTRYPFGDERYPVVRDQVRVRLPKDRPFKYAVANGKLPVQIAEEGKDRTYEWTALHRLPLPLDENLPSKEELRTELAGSTFASWEEVGQWKLKLRADCWKCSAAIHKIVEDVTRGLKTPEEKARALAYWVRRRIRYVSVGPIRHDYTPHLPDVVLENLFGDCKDQAQLLALMLREAGLLVYLVTLGALDDGQIMPEVPSPWGTHAIVLVQIDGKDHWIDTTASIAPWDFLPRDDCGRVAYLTDDKGGIRVTRTPAFTAASNRLVQTTQVTVETDGSSHCKRTLTLHGSAAISQRDQWTEAPPGERRRLVTTELQDAHSRCRLRALTVADTGLRDFDQPVRATLEFDIPGHFAGEGEREGSLTDSKIWGRLLAYNLDPDRQAPFELASPFDSVHHYTVQLPPAYRFDSLPTARSIRSKWGSFEVTVMPDVQSPHRLDVYFHTRLDKTRVLPEDFAAFRKFHEDVTKQWRVWLTLKPTEDEEDEPLLEKLLATSTEDEFSAATLARLYVKHQKLEDARRVLRKAVTRHGGSTALWELTVKTAKSLEAEETAYREMVRRFPDEPRYAVALGATLIKRSENAAARAVLEPLAEKGKGAVRGAAYYQLARSAFLQGKSADALASLEAAQRADPEVLKDVASMQFKGQVYEKLGKVGEAIEAHAQALKIDSDRADTLVALVRLELAAGKKAEALQHLRRYTLIASDGAADLTPAAEFYLQLGRDDEAFDLARAAPTIKPADGGQLDSLTSARGNYVLGLVSYHRKDFGAAVKYLEKAKRDAPAAVALIRSYLAMGGLAAAQRWVDVSRIRALESKDLQQVRGEVTTLLQRRTEIIASAHPPTLDDNNFERAASAVVCAERAYREGRTVKDVRKLLDGAFFSKNVDLGAAYALRGLLSLETGHLARALEDSERAIRLSPGEARGYYVRGRVRLERGEKDALADLTRAAELTGRKDGILLHWLAAALFQGGNPLEALAVQREALRLRPNDPEVIEQLHEFEAVQTRTSRH